MKKTEYRGSEEIKKDKMGWICGTYGGLRNSCTNFGQNILSEEITCET